ncbi:CGNR zinc finger domain-containing protein [Streptomyces sp. NPDC087440]|uniref:CGNR zinc finger domain-containing protein n=1 Tax=Streptomyces sp. NPDC087440 TaxID=3365790 RepID=UPI0038220734
MGASGTGTTSTRTPWWFDSGRVCLDLLATRTRGQELLVGARELAEWAVGAGLVPGGTALRVDPAWAPRFHRLREQIADVLAGGRGSALDEVNALAALPPPAPRAVRTADGSLACALAAEPRCEQLLAVLARDAVALLTDPVARARLRRCEGDTCERLYLDTSRGRRRRWCSSETCGNRERVARHRRRAAVTAVQP